MTNENYEEDFINETNARDIGLTDQGWGGKREGSGRHQKYGSPTTLIAIRLPGSLLKTIDQHAKKNNLNRSEAIVKGLTQYFKQS